jgi:Flp pilus assembly protein TadG
MRARQPQSSTPTAAGEQDRGSVSVELAVAVPMILMVLGLLGQGFGWGMAYLAVSQAADHAAQTTRLVGGTPAAGRADAQSVLRHLGGHLVTDTRIEVTRGSAVTTVTIRAHSRGVPIPVTVTAFAPTERFT